MPVEGRGLGSRAALNGGKDVETGESLSAPERVQRLRQALHAKAKEAPGFRFYSLCDKVWRADVLAVAWQAVRRNGGAAGVDGETVADIESYGVERWQGPSGRDGGAKKTAPNPSVAPEGGGPPRFIWLPRMLEPPSRSRSRQDRPTTPRKDASC